MTIWCYDKNAKVIVGRTYYPMTDIKDLEYFK